MLVGHMFGIFLPQTEDWSKNHFFACLQLIGGINRFISSFPLFFFTKSVDFLEEDNSLKHTEVQFSDCGSFQIRSVHFGIPRSVKLVFHDHMFSSKLEIQQEFV